MGINNEELFSNLKSFFGFDNFKGEQEEISKNILAKRNTFVIMPTGGGKSMCYQLPAIISEGTAIVISPLIALMKNQVDQIRAFGGDDSIAHFLNSSLNKAETLQVKADLVAGKTKLLYVAPESFAKQENVDFLKSLKISFFAIDEAHCISEWGHDFRPEYRKIKQIVSSVGENLPIIALTATATPKVQQDIIKNLQMTDADLFKSSFNRTNLFYEIRPKKDILKDIIKFIKKHDGKSGIIYCLSRKKVEEVAENLNLNGIKALPYHAGLESKVRAETQDKFLMEDVNVIVATIAFGMGIDKPDVRFVIHHDIPKSMEGYYQETGRAGRDGGEGVCLAFYAQKDVDKLTKFLKDKSVSEREIGTQILKEVIDYAESGVCRRKQILHYFGEKYDEKDCKCMCDNCKKTATYFEAESQLLSLLKLVDKVGDKFDDLHLLNIFLGLETAQTIAYKHQNLPEFGQGKLDGELLWKSVVRQAILLDFLVKDIENYGLLSLTQKGRDFIDNSHPIKFILNTLIEDFSTEDDENEKQVSSAVDMTLMLLLKELRKKTAEKLSVQPSIIFQEPSLEEMCINYPTSMDELTQISGVGKGKALKFGKPFIDLIAKYVEENDIDRPIDFVIKSQANKSALKISIIQNIDRKISLEDIAKSKGITYNEILNEVEAIVNSGTKLNLTYFVDEMIDEDRQEEVFDYFRTAENDSIDLALSVLGESDYTIEDIQLMKIKFTSDLGN
ncbi:MAG: ATP-dependent DNA helicase [Sphingobacteriaceae bacterium]|nr:ATP-dependent DNA helicase [Sphingobacteriaceae bacterium]